MLELPADYKVGAFAQRSEMFIEQIQVKTISLKNFNSSGKLWSSQEYVVGKINQSGNTLRISIQAKFYDETNNLTSSYTGPLIGAILNNLTFCYRSLLFTRGSKKLRYLLLQVILKICMD
jgi:hypothetical protein